MRLLDGLEGPVACPESLEVNLSWVADFHKPLSDDPNCEVIVAPGRDLAKATRIEVILSTLHEERRAPLFS